MTKLDPRRVVNAVNTMGHPTVRLMLHALRDEFPEYHWYLTSRSLLDFEDPQPGGRSVQASRSDPVRFPQ